MKNNSLSINTHRTDDERMRFAGEAVSESASALERPTDDAVVDPRTGKISIQGGVIGENVAFGEELKSVLKNGIRDIEKRAQSYAANTEAQRAGFVAEADHCATFNARAALDRSGNRAVLARNGNHGDYRIINGKKVLVEGEVKYYGNAEGTEYALRGYGNKQRVAPADQVEEIAKIARKKATKELAQNRPNRQAVGKEHQEVTEHVTNRISDGKRGSTPRTYKENRATTAKASQGKLTELDVLPGMNETLRRSAVSGAQSGAVMGAGISAFVSSVTNIKAVCKGKKSITKAAGDAIIEVGCATADGAVKGAVGSAVRAGCVQLAGRTTATAAKSILRSGGPAAAAVGGVELLKDTVLLAVGEINGHEYKQRVKKTAATTAGGWAGAEGGAAIGTAICPGIGTVVFGILGGILGGIGASWSCN